MPYKFKYETSEGEYIFAKYVLPIAFSFVAMGIFSALLYASIVEPSLEIRVAATMVGLMSCAVIFFVGRQIFFVKKAVITENGIDIDRQNFSWNDVVRIRQFFIFRVEFECFKNGVHRKFSIPFPFPDSMGSYLENYGIMNYSKFLNDLQELKDRKSGK